MNTVAVCCTLPLSETLCHCTHAPPASHRSCLQPSHFSTRSARPVHLLRRVRRALRSIARSRCWCDERPTRGTWPALAAVGEIATGARAWRVRGERVGGGADVGRMSVGRRGVWLVYTLVQGVGRTTIISLERGRGVVEGGGCGEIRMRDVIAGCPRALYSLQALPHTAVQMLDGVSKMNEGPHAGFTWRIGGEVCIDNGNAGCQRARHSTASSPT